MSEYYNIYIDSCMCAEVFYVTGEDYHRCRNIIIYMHARGYCFSPVFYS
jgi:hypothetical protein